MHAFEDRWKVRNNEAGKLGCPYGELSCRQTSNHWWKKYSEGPSWSYYVQFSSAKVTSLLFCRDVASGVFYRTFSFQFQPEPLRATDRRHSLPASVVGSRDSDVLRSARFLPLHFTGSNTLVAR